MSSSVTSFFCEPCSQNEVFQKIVSLNERKAVGIENIPIKFIKIAAEYITPLLANIINNASKMEYFLHR